MTINQMEIFYAVCKTRSFSRAANMLYISQPADSKCISTLEAELEVTFFEKANNTLSLTRAGEIFYKYVDTIKQQFQALQEELSAAAAEARHDLRLGIPETWNPAYVNQPLQALFSEISQDFHLRIESCRLSDLFLRLQNGKLDLVLTHDLYLPGSAGIQSDFYCQTGAGILCAKNNAEELPALLHHPFLLYDSDIEKRFNTLLRNICSDQGIEMKLRNHKDLQKALFETGVGSGIMFFTEWDLPTSNQAFRYVPLPVQIPVRIYYKNEGIRPVTEQFLKAIRNQAPSDQRP